MELVPRKSAKKKQVRIQRPQSAKGATESPPARSGVGVNPVGSESAAESPGQLTEDHPESKRPLAKAPELTAVKTADQETEPPRRESDFYQTVNVPDSATARDTLGFEPYVQALATFLTNPRTRGPLTISIEGEWGSGKSSFMLQLRDALAPAVKAWNKTSSRSDEAPVIVEFNAWRHDKSEELWAAFARALQRAFSEREPPPPPRGERRKSRQVRFPRRWRGHAKLLRLRFNWRQGWLDMVRFVALLGALLLLSLGLPVVFGEESWDTIQAWLNWSNAEILDRILRGILIASGGLGYLAVAVALFKRLRTFIGDPFSVDLRKHLRAPNYDAKTSFIEEFHNDFKRILDAYVDRDRKVVCFIDDLDRCEVPKAAELMQALNLMISDDPRMIFLLGMDREKVAAGLAVKFKDLIPYLPEAERGLAEESSLPEPSAAASRGRRFGHDSIEKFVQISYALPQTAERNLDRFLRDLSPEPVRPSESFLKRFARRWQPWAPKPPGTPSAKPQGGPQSSEEEQSPLDGPSDEQRVAEGEQATQQNYERLTELEESEDDPAFTAELVRLVAPAFDHNPRRLKQFLNLFRLNVATANATQLLFFEEGKPEARVRL